LVALIAVGVAIPTRLAATAAGLSNKEADEIAELRPDERKALRALAPYAVDAVPFLASHAKPLCAAAVGIAVVALIGYRMAAIKRVSNARGKSLHRDNRDRQDARGSGGHSGIFPAQDGNNSGFGGQPVGAGFGFDPQRPQIHTRDG